MITVEFLRSVDLFRGLPGEDASALAALGKEEVYRKGDVIFREREPGDRICVVVSGVVEVTKAAPGDARSFRLACLERGDVLGEISTFDGGPRSATAVAAVVPETRLASWDSAAFHRFLASRPAAGKAILEALVRRMSARIRQTSDAVHTLLRALDTLPA